MRGKAGINPITNHAWRTHPNGGNRYIGEPNGLPGQNGVDWGWVTNPNEAMELTPYWQRRFKSDMRKCGYEISIDSK